MKKVISVLCFMGLVGCSTSDFFGARVVGEYQYHFKGQIKCAFIENSYEEKKCFCIMAEHGTGKTFNDTTCFMLMLDWVCETSSDVAPKNQGEIK